MKIVYIITTRIPTEKAHGYQICKMCEEFARNGVDVELVIPVRKNFTQEDVFTYYGLERNLIITKLWSPSFFLWKIPESLIFRLNSIFFVLASFISYYKKKAIFITRSPEIVWVFGIFGKKVVYDAHNIPVTKLKLYTLFLRKAFLIICNSEGTANAHQKLGLMKTLVVHNSVDLQAFDIEVSDDEIASLKKKFCLPLDKKIVVYVGHLYAWKGVDVVIRAAKKTKLQIAFALVGGTENDIIAYRKMIQADHIENVFLLGHQKREIIPKILKLGDLFIIPNVPISLESSEMTSPLKIFEYMAARRPIVASRLPSIKNILNEDSCYFFDAGDEDDMLRAIQESLELGDVSRQKVEKAFFSVKDNTWEKRAKKIIQALDVNRDEKIL